jgi:predicted Zn-dependent peptidase
MDSIRKELKKGVTLNTVFTEKFKTNTLSVNFVFPFLPENNSYYALIVQILKQGCRKYPSVAALAGRLDTLYASDIAFSLSTVGESQVLTVSADFLRNRCLDEPMDLFKEIVDCLFEMLRYPLLDEDGRNFRPDIIESEKRHLRDMIRAKFNNKTVYAMDRCRALMCKGEPSAVNGNGTEEMLSKIDISRLYEMYKEIFKKSRMELFFVGDEKHERVEELVSPLLSLFSANSQAKILF